MLPKTQLTKVTQITLQDWRWAEQRWGHSACGGWQEGSLPENLRTRVLVPAPPPPSPQATGDVATSPSQLLPCAKGGQGYPCATHPAHLAAEGPGTWADRLRRSAKGLQR